MTKCILGRKECVCFTLPGHSSSRKSGQGFRLGCEQSPGARLLSGSLASFLHSPGLADAGGTAPQWAGLPIPIIHQDTEPTILIWAVPQLRLPLPRWQKVIGPLTLVFLKTVKRKCIPELSGSKPIPGASLFSQGYSLLLARVAQKPPRLQILVLW